MNGDNIRGIALTTAVVLGLAGTAFGVWGLLDGRAHRAELARQHERWQRIEGRLEAQHARLQQKETALANLKAEAARRQAGAALIDSEAMVWSLEGRALKEAEAVLPSDEAMRELKNEHALSDTEREQRLRAFLRSRWSPALLSDAQAMLNLIDAGSRRLLSDQAKSDGIRPEELLLEWLTYEAAIDFDMVTRIWKQQGNFRGEAQGVVASILEGLTELPHVDAGVTVLERTGGRIVINVFGARVVEETLADAPAQLRGDAAVVRWQSNYNYLRGVLRGKSPQRILEEEVPRENGRYRVTYGDWFREYLDEGHKLAWATQFRENNVLSVAHAARKNEARARLGQAPLQPAAQRSLRELFPALAPAVPMIRQVGAGGFGSGFLVERDGKLLVVTNRHVIEGSPKGVQIHFFPAESAKGEPDRLIVPASKALIVAIHRGTDLALIDVSQSAAVIRKRNIKPVQLAAADHRVTIGEHVFAIGHPGAGQSILTQSLSDGIVSATGREQEGDPARYLQVTVPINPGNSGGPLFDDAGRVVGINSFIIRKNKAQDLALEALNFAMESRHAHELLSDRSQSLGAREIAGVLNPTTSLDAAVRRLAPKIGARADLLAKKGYRLYDNKKLAESVWRFTIQPRNRIGVTVECSAGKRYCAAVSGEGANDIDLAVADADGALLATETGPGRDPGLFFTIPRDGEYRILVLNPTDDSARGLIALLIRASKPAME